MSLRRTTYSGAEMSAAFSEARTKQAPVSEIASAALLLLRSRSCPSGYRGPPSRRLVSRMILLSTMQLTVSASSQTDNSNSRALKSPKSTRRLRTRGATDSMFRRPYVRLTATVVSGTELALKPPLSRADADQGKIGSLQQSVTLSLKNDSLVETIAGRRLILFLP